MPRLTKSSFPLLCFAVVCALSSLGCKTTCNDADSTPETVSDGTTNASRTVYESTPFDGHYRAFPPQKQLVFEHGLKTIPVDIQTYVAFSPCPLAPKGTCDDDAEPAGEIAESAGDISPVSDVNETTFTVRNGTCQTFYLRVTAEADPDAPAPEPKPDGG